MRVSRVRVGARLGWLGLGLGMGNAAPPLMTRRLRCH